MRLILLRHPAPHIAAGLCYGSSDIAVAPAALTTTLATLAAALPAGLPLYSSPMQRCTALALPLAARLGAPAPRLDARLAEMDFGDWELRAWDSIARDAIDGWAADPVHYRPGGGESVLQVATRVAAFLCEVLAEGIDAIVVCHAGTIRLLAAMQHTIEQGQALQGTALEQAALRAAATPHRIGYGASLVLPF